MSEALPHRRTLPPADASSTRIRELAATVAERLRGRYGEIIDSMDEAIRDGIADLAGPETMAELVASIDGNVDAILRMLCEDDPFARPPQIPAAVQYAVRLAQREVPAASLRRAYHFGSDDLLAQIFDEVRSLDVDPELRLHLLHHLAGWLHSYVDWITRVVMDAYEEERRQISTRRASQTATLVRAVLDDLPDCTDGFAERTGYRLGHWHLAAFVWVDDANPAVDHTEVLEARVGELAARMRSTAVLTTAVDRSLAWVWFGAPEEPADHVRLARDVMRTHTDRLRIVFGSPGRGVDGFRRSHRTAGAAHRVASAGRTGEAVLSHDDRAVALVAMLIDDLAGLRDWASSVLGPLAQDHENAVRLRETLRVFLECGRSYQATAERLMLHRNSVKYRIEKAEELRGVPLDRGRLDLEVALEVAHLLGSATLAAREA